MSEATQLVKRIRTGVKAIIVHDGKILMLHERVVRSGVTVEIMDFPGGGIEHGEELKEALKREVMEEVGLSIAVGTVIGAWSFILGDNDHSDEKKAGVQIVCIAYKCSIMGELKLDLSNNPAQEDIFDARWYTKEELLLNKNSALGVLGMVEAVEALDI